MGFPWDCWFEVDPFNNVSATVQNVKGLTGCSQQKNTMPCTFAEYQSLKKAFILSRNRDG